MNEAVYTDSQLILKFLKEELTEKEKLQLQEWKSSSPKHDLLLEQLRDLDTRNKYLAVISSIETEAAHKKLAAKIFETEVAVIKPVHRVHFLKMAWFRYA